jgi:C1A family cysteine protease
MSSTSAVNVSYYETVQEDQVDQMKAALQQQPLSVLVEADKRVFQSYRSGVLDSTSCGTSLDHAVLAVGYGTENGQEYWLVKNSWDTTWGDQGYIKLAIVDGKGICGVQMAPAYPTSN